MDLQDKNQNQFDLVVILSKLSPNNISVSGKMACRTKTRVNLWLVSVLTYQLSSDEQWWVLIVLVSFQWKQTPALSSSSGKKKFYLSFPQNGRFILHWNALSIWYFSSSNTLLKTSFINNMGVSSRKCYFSIDDKQKRNDNAEKIKLPRRKTWAEFSFSSHFFPIQRILRPDYKPLETNESLSTYLSGFWLLLNPCCHLW